MTTNTGKAIFASLAIHAGVVAAAVHLWKTPVRQPGSGAECLAVCLFSPLPETPLLAVENEEAVADAATDEQIEEEFQTEQEIQSVPVAIPAAIGVTEENALRPPSTLVPSRGVETQPPTAKPAARTTAKTQPLPGTRANAPSSGTKSGGAATVTIPPQLKSKGSLRYRETAETRGKRLTVWLTLEVDERGWVRAVRVNRGCGYDHLDDAAAAAAKRYRFTPALAGGSAVPWTFDHAVTFAL